MISDKPADAPPEKPKWSKWIWAAIVVCIFVFVVALSSIGWVIARLSGAYGALSFFSATFTYTMYIVGAALAFAMAVGIWHLIDAVIRLVRRRPYDEESPDNP